MFPSTHILFTIEIVDSPYKYNFIIIKNLNGVDI
jgi:hypothetical protein